MKTAFSLLPTSENPSSMHMLIEVGWYGISIVWYRNDPFSIEGVLSYNFNEEQTATELAGNIENIIDKNFIFREVFSSVVICYNFKESVLVPSEYYNESLEAGYVQLIYGIDPGALIKSDSFRYDNDISNPGHIYNIYRIPEPVHTVFAKHFLHARIIHSSSLQIEHEKNEVICCTVYHSSIKVFVYSSGKLKLVQQFDYTTPADVVYHLLNICTQHQISTSEVVLKVSGMIDISSNLYYELYKYFLNISLEDVPDDVFLSSQIQSFPLHFFSHLTRLTKCVL